MQRRHCQSERRRSDGDGSALSNGSVGTRQVSCCTQGGLHSWQCHHQASRWADSQSGARCESHGTGPSEAVSNRGWHRRWNVYHCARIRITRRRSRSIRLQLLWRAIQHCRTRHQRRFLQFHSRCKYRHQHHSQVFLLGIGSRRSAGQTDGQGDHDSDRGFDYG